MVTAAKGHGDDGTGGAQGEATSLHRLYIAAPYWFDDATRCGPPCDRLDSVPLLPRIRGAAQPEFQTAMTCAAAGGSV
jgi:hypothetical protein